MAAGPARSVSALAEGTRDGGGNSSLRGLASTGRVDDRAKRPS